MDALLNERPRSISMKKKSFYNEVDGTQEDPLLGKIHKNFYLDIECMRLNAEKERICHYREVARKSAISYYKALKKIMEKNLIHVMVSKGSPEKAPANSSKSQSDENGKTKFFQQKETKVNCIYYLTDYIKLVIENGNDFILDYLTEIVSTMIFEEFSDEVIETIRIIIEQFEFDQEKFKDWIETQTADPAKQQKLRTILGTSEELS